MPDPDPPLPLWWWPPLEFEVPLLEPEEPLLVAAEPAPASVGGPGASVGEAVVSEEVLGGDEGGALDSAEAWVEAVARGWLAAARVRRDFGAGRALSDTRVPEKLAASAGSPGRVAAPGEAVRLAGAPPPAAREIPKAAPKAITTHATPIPASLTTPTA